ncbi:MAG: DNA primase, partial [Thermofilaceae archaeon]
MGGLPVNAKYVIHARIEVDGIVDKSDIIGALFGQTEGLLGAELDLRELQNNGRIGRIEVNVSK